MTDRLWSSHRVVTTPHTLVIMIVLMMSLVIMIKERMNDDETWVTTTCYSEQGYVYKGELMAATIKYCSSTVSLLIVYVCPDDYL